VSGEDYLTLTPEVASNALLHVVQMYVASLADKQRALQLAVAQGSLLQKQLAEALGKVADLEQELRGVKAFAQANLKPRGFKFVYASPGVDSPGAVREPEAAGEVPRARGPGQGQPLDGEALGQGEQGQEAPQEKEVEGRGG
jgi:hypothetical protein